MAECLCKFEECLLCGARLFSGASASLVCEIQGLIAKRSYQPGEILCHEGDPTIVLFFLTKGFVKLTTSLPDGREQILRLGFPGQAVGLEALSDRLTPYTATTLTPVTACTMRLKDMLKVVEGDPETSMRVIGFLNRELERARTLIRDLGLMSAKERVASFLLSLAPVAEGAGKGIPMPLSRQEIAEMLGLTVETVSRQMAKLKREGVIRESDNHIYLLEDKRLRNLAGLPSESVP